MSGRDVSKSDVEDLDSLSEDCGQRFRIVAATGHRQAEGEGSEATLT